MKKIVFMMLSLLATASTYGQTAMSVLDKAAGDQFGAGEREDGVLSSHE